MTSEIQPPSQPSPPFSQVPNQPREPLRTWKPTTAGILTIIAGVILIIGGIAAGVAIDIFGGLGFGGLVGGFLVIPGIVALIGGIFALRRRVWGMALAGAIIALIAFFVPGILAIIFVSMGKGEFR